MSILLTFLRVGGGGGAWHIYIAYIIVYVVWIKLPTSKEMSFCNANWIEPLEWEYNSTPGNEHQSKRTLPHGRYNPWPSFPQHVFQFQQSIWIWNFVSQFEIHWKWWCDVKVQINVLHCRCWPYKPAGGQIKVGRQSARGEHRRG